MSTPLNYTICGSVLRIASRRILEERVVAVMRGDAPSLRVATVNPDFLLQAWRTSRFRRVLAQADVHTIDGIGIVLWARCGGHRVPHYAGADLLHDMFAAAQRNEWRVQVLCRRDGLSRWHDVAQALAVQYPHLRCSGQDVAQDANVAGVDLLRDTPTIYLCNFGAPAQEYFLEALRTNGARGVFAGVGGSFDFLTGAVVRAPQWMRSAGLEWLWRTARQPKRIGKMLRSVVLFPVVALWERLKRG